jgi:predicted pyridoxine 5'-phosphate oxidase superfamily flavin-nucleotide-binding protein
MEAVMNDQFPSDIAFTPAVKAVQERQGSRHAYARMETGQGWETTITPDIAAFVAAQTSVFFATANAQGQPYVQHRGGAPGFLHVLDEHTIAFADLRGNRQYITTGNLAENAKAHLFLIDYANQQRVKIWGEARVVDDDPALLDKLAAPGDRSRAERAIVFTVKAWDANCAKNIPQRFEAADVERAIASRDRRIAELEREVTRLKSANPEAKREPAAVR